MNLQLPAKCFDFFRAIFRLNLRGFVYIAVQQKTRSRLRLIY